MNQEGIKSFNRDPGSQSIATQIALDDAYWHFFLNSPIMMSIFNYQNGVVDILAMNHALEKLYGITLDQLKLMNPFQYGVSDQNVQFWISKIEECSKSRKTEFEYSRTYQGQLRHLHITISVIQVFPDGGKQMSAIFQDITDLKNSKQELLIGLEKFSLIEALTNFGTWHMEFSNPNRLIWSNSMNQVFGLKTPKTILTLEEFQSFIHPDDVEDLMRDVELMTKGHHEHIHEFRIVSDEGRVRWVEGRGRAVLDASGNVIGMAGIALDISKRKKSEEFIQSQEVKIRELSKMSALGQMAAGIAHEINNPLTIIRAHLELIEGQNKNLNTDPKIDKSIQSISKTIDRIAAIIEGLRFFSSSGHQIEATPNRMSDIIRETLSFCSESLKKNGIQLDVQSNSNDCRLMCRPVQISQILLNLISNAAHAVENASRKEISISVQCSPTDIVVQVADTGPGIQKQDLGRLFQPFYTTRAPGKGMGLGLSISRSLAQQNGGSLVYKRHSDRTIFELKVPRGKYESC